jgi:RHS repeat-associated protein
MQNKAPWGTFRLSIIAILVVVTIAALTWFAGGEKSVDSETSASNAESIKAKSPKQYSPRTGAAMPDFDSAAETISAAYIGDGEPGDTENWSKGIASEHSDTQRLLTEFSEARNDTVPQLTKQLEQKRDSFLAYRSEIEGWLAGRRLENSGLAEQVRERFDRLDHAFDDALSAKTVGERHQALATLQGLLQQLQAPPVEVQAQPQPTFTQQEPTKLTTDDIPNAPPPAYAAPAENTGARAEPSSHPKTLAEFVDQLMDALGIGTAQAAPPSAAAPEAVACGYQAADLGNALPEINLNDPDVLALAEKLQYSPVKIYEYVKNQIEFQPYFGSLKGASATLVSGSGNATDQASLLIALLRIAKIPARYVYGEVAFQYSDPRMLDWLGVKAVNGAWSRLGVGQIPKELLPSGRISFSHVWIEACVPYGNYRGSRNDNSGFHWIPLDPSFKEMTYTNGTTVADIPGFSFDYNAYLSKRTTVMPQEALKDQMEAALGTSLVHGGGYRGAILQRNIDVLPSTLPYDVLNFKDWGSGQSETAVLPDTHRYFAQFTVLNQSGTALAPTLNRPMAELASSRLTLSFVQTNASNTAAGNVAAWQFGTAMEVPCATTSNYQQTLVQPVFRRDGVDITPAGTRTAVGFCTRSNQLTIRLSLNNVTINQVQYWNIGAYNYHALQVYAFHASDDLIEARSAKLLDAVETTANPNTRMDDTLGEYLHIAGLKYMDYITEAGKTVGRLYGETGDSGNHIGLTSTAMKVEYVFDLPFAVSRKGLLVDVPGGSLRSRNIVTGAANYNNYLLAGYSASAYESYIWQEQAHVDAVSTIRGLQFANDTGLPVVALTGSADVDTQLNIGCATSPINLNYSTAVKNSLKNLFAQGYFKITLPRCLINYDGWAGAVWVAEKATLDGNQNLHSASTSYTISGDYTTAQGGYSLARPISNYFDQALGTGFRSVFTPTIATSLTVGPVPNSNIKIDTPHFGPGSNTGYVAGKTNVGGDPVNLVSGNLYHPERDLAIRGRGGLDIVFERTYNSNVRKDGPLGFGWTHSFNHQLQFFDENANGTVDTVIWVDGSGSASRLSVAGTASGVPLNATLTPQTGLRVTAKREANGEYSLKEKSGLVFYFQNIPGTAGQTAKLVRVVDRNNNALSFGYSGANLSTVVDGIGRTLRFWYDNGGSHFTRITDWAGRTFRYTYDGRGNLVKFESPEVVAGRRGSSTAYTYYTAADGTNLDHALKTYTRPNGNGMSFEYYANGKIFRHTDSQGHTYTFRYNKFRRETTTVDERGVSQTYLFNEWGQQLQHQQGDGSRLVYEYQDAANPLNETQRRDALGNTIRYAYDASGNVTTMTLPDGSTVTYEGYNAFHLPTKTKDANGHYTLYRYDARGNRTEVIALKAGVNTDTPTPAQIAAWTIHTYDGAGNLTRTKRVRDFTTQEGPYVEFGYDASALNPTSIKRCGLQQLGEATLADRCTNASQAFDALGRPTVAVDARFYPAETRYNDDGQITRATDALRQWRDFAYDNNGNPIGASLIAFDGNGVYGLLQQDVVEYDALDRPVVRRNTAGHATQFTYDEVGNVLKITNPDGYSVRFEYDALNRPTRAFDQQGNAVVTEYDIGGRPIRVTDPNGLVTQYAYYDQTQNGRLKRLTGPDGRYTDYFYDQNGNVTRTVDNGGRETLTEYDVLNRPVKTIGPVHDALGLTAIRQVTETQYTALGDVQKIRAGYRTPTGSETLTDQATYGYDDFGRVIEATDANGHTTRWTYDAYGNPIRRVSPNGHVVEWEYDHTRNGLLIRRTAKLSDTDPAPHVTQYTYDALGQVLTAQTPGVTYQYTYDTAHRLATVTDSRGPKTLTYRHSPGGLLDSLEDSEGHRRDFLYDAVGRLSAVQAPEGERVNFVFDGGGRLLETTMANGYGTLYRYTPEGYLGELVNRAAGGTEVSHHTYQYDPLGRRTGHLEAIAGAETDYTYQYDALDRLREVRTNAGATLAEAYAYDAYGNRRERIAPDGSVQRYVYDAAQQLREIRSGSDTGAILASYTYDLTGNLIQRSGGGTTLDLAYDALERLVAASGTGIAPEAYTYDHQDRRIEVNVDGTPRRSVYAGLEIWSDYGSTWTQAQALYTYAGLDRPLIRTGAGGTAYYHADALGSVVAVTDAAGSITASARYAAFGQTLSGGALPRYGYAGREPDATGLIYYRARYYDPTLGRFTQRDPAGFADGLNPYAYVGNNPVSFTDPLGLSRMNPIATQVQSYFAGVSKPYTSLSGGTGTASVSSGLGGSTSSGRVVFADSGETASDAGRDMIGGSPTSCGQRLCNQIGTAPGPLDVLDISTSLGAPEAKLGTGIVGAIMKGVAKGTASESRFINGAKVTDRVTGNVLEGTVDLKPTLDRISAGKTFPHRNDGAVFGNKEGLLPQQPAGYYREYVHPTPGVNGPGPQRIVTGQGGEIFYTPDHYRTFIRVNP